MKSLLGLWMVGMALLLAPMAPDVVRTGWSQQGGGVPSAVVDIGSYVVMGQGAGVVSLDVSDPTQPRLAGSLVMPQMVRSAAASGAHVAVIVCNPRFGPSPAVPCSLRILALASDGALAEVSHVDLGGILSDLVVGSGYAYVATARNGIAVVDVRDALHPVPLAPINRLTDVSRLAISGTRLAASREGGVTVVDVTDVAQPRVLGRVELKGSLRQLVLNGDAIYVIVEDQDSGLPTLSLIDIHDIGNRSTVRRLPVDGTVEALAISAGRLFVLTSRQLLTMDVTTPTIPALVASSDIFLLANAVAVRGQLLYVASGGCTGKADRWILGGLHIVDVADPGQALVVGSYGSAERVGAVAFLDPDHVAVTVSCTQFMGAQQWTMRLGNDESPTLPQRGEPVPLTRTGVEGVIWDLQRRDGLLYVAAWDYDVPSGGLRIVDVAAADRPGVVGKLDLGQGATGVSLFGTTAYLIGLDEVYVVDVAESANPRLLNQVPAGPSLTSVAVDEAGRTLLVGSDSFNEAGRPNGLQFYDAADSPALRLVADLRLTGRPERIVIRGDIAWVGAGAEILAIHIAVAAAPQIVGRWAVAGYIHDLVLADDWLVATGTTGSGYEGRLWGARMLAGDRLGGIEELELPDVAWSVAMDRGRVVVGAGSAGLLVGHVEELFGIRPIEPSPTVSAIPVGSATPTPTYTATPEPGTATPLTPTHTRRPIPTGRVYLPQCRTGH